MVDFLASTKKMDKHQAYQLTSLAGDVAITQLVDGTMGVHVKMPKGIFKFDSSRVQWVQGFIRFRFVGFTVLLRACSSSPPSRPFNLPAKNPPTRSMRASRRRMAITRRIMAASS